MLGEGTGTIPGMARVRVRLVGSDARLGRVPAVDVARLLTGLEGAMARAAGHVRGKQVRPTGRWASVIENAVHLRLVALKQGSVVAVLEVPTLDLPEGSLDLGDIEQLGEAALERTLSTAAAKRGGDADVAAALSSWALELGVGSRYEAVEIGRRRARKWQTVRIDQEQQIRLTAIAGRKETHRGALVGQLVEADFEKRTAHLRSPSGRVAMEFEPQQADAIHSALRHQASVTGITEQDERTHEIRSIKVQEITTAEQLATGLLAGQFWDDRSVEERGREQGIAHPQRLEDLADRAASDEEIEAVMVPLQES